MQFGETVCLLDQEVAVELQHRDLSGLAAKVRALRTRRQVTQLSPVAWLPLVVCRTGMPGEEDSPPDDVGRRALLPSDFQNLFRATSAFRGQDIGGEKKRAPERPFL
ncbi:MAG: hypothetical protein RKP46_15770 [Candidatus Accumulibacter sp.]|uniref:hypothetical protein n=1 Tax=Accumulibacter sp. TaxID=2053492 RepID=UPI0028783035|nr:hypothetical protein [Accumulibacter sp.]MDS4015786.1 hypothetical protein [Accumulibacter sp.]